MLENRLVYLVRALKVAAAVSALLVTVPCLAQTGAAGKPGDEARPAGARPARPARPEGPAAATPRKAEGEKDQVAKKKPARKDPAKTRPATTAAKPKPKTATKKPPPARVAVTRKDTSPDETRPTSTRKPPARKAPKPKKPKKPKKKIWWWSASAGGGWYAPFPVGKTDTRPSDIPLRHLGFGYIRLGIRWKWLEPDVSWEIASVRDYPYHMYDVTVDLGASAYTYEFRRAKFRFRLRHGLRIGYRFTANARCYAKRDYPADDPCDEDRSNHTFNFFQIKAHLCDVQFKLYSGLWLEVSPATFGWPYFYFASLGVRWEGLI